MALPTLLTPEVAPRPVTPGGFDVRVTPQAYGADIGQALSATGQKVAEDALAEKKKADAFAASEADYAFATQADKIFTDFKAQKQKGALDPSSYFAEIEKIRTKVASGLANESQMEHFKMMSNARTERWHQAMFEHSNTEAEHWKTGIAASAYEDAKSEVGRFFDKPKVVGDQINTALPLNEERWRAAGNDEKVISTLRRKLVKDLVEASLEGYEGTGKAVEGIKWMDSAIPGVANDDGTPMTVRQALGARVGHWEGKFRGLANTQAGITLVEGLINDDAEDKLQDPATKQIREELATDILRQKFNAGEINAEVFKVANDHVRLLNTIYKDGYTQERSRLVGRAWPEFMKTHTVASIKAVDGGKLWQRLKDGPEAYHFERLEDEWARAKESEPRTPEQVRAAVQFGMDLALNPHMFDNWDADRFWRERGMKMHKNDVERLGMMLATVQGRPDKLTGLIGPVIKLYNELGGQAGAFPNMYDPARPQDKDIANWRNRNDVDTYQAGLNYLYDKIKEWRDDDKNKKLSTIPPEVYQGWVNEMVQKGKNPDGTWFGIFGGNTTRVRAATTGTAFEVRDVSQIPRAAYDKIERTLKALGKPWDARAVLNDYNEAMRLQARPQPPAAPGEQPDYGEY
jgi:hypothetical protein